VKRIAYLLGIGLVFSLLPPPLPTFAAFPGGNGYIVFQSRYPLGITVSSDDGSSQLGLGNGEYPNLSPNGKRIVFEDVSDIWVMNADGSGRHRLTNDGSTASDSEPAWSPDGARIVFVGTRADFFNTKRDVFVMNADGPHVNCLTSTDPADRHESLRHAHRDRR
jgi:Tol biopolymer transport system component